MAMVGSMSSGFCCELLIKLKLGLRLITYATGFVRLVPRGVEKTRAFCRASKPNMCDSFPRGVPYGTRYWFARLGHHFRV